jgi:hypothetical protein
MDKKSSQNYNYTYLFYTGYQLIEATRPIFLNAHSYQSQSSYWENLRSSRELRVHVRCRGRVRVRGIRAVRVRRVCRCAGKRTRGRKRQPPIGG